MIFKRGGVVIEDQKQNNEKGFNPFAIKMVHPHKFVAMI
jgi:hypothetical protein